MDEMHIGTGRLSKVDRHSKSTNEDQGKEIDDDFAVRGTGPLSKVYQICNMVFLESTNFEDANETEEWNQTIKEEMAKIQECHWT